MLRLDATRPWLFASLLSLSALASAQTPAPAGTGESPGIDGSGNAPLAPIAEPLQRSPANILEDGPRDVGTKVDPTVCNNRPLPDDLLAQCRRWLLIASVSAHTATRQGGVDAASYRQTARI